MASDRFKGKRILLTGCVANIGRATAERLASEGGSLFLVDIDPRVSETAEAVRALGARVDCGIADVSDPDAVKAATDSAAEFLGGIDVIVNNAGIQRSGVVEEFSFEDWDATLRINAGSVFLFAKYGLPHLKAAGGGAIVNTASIAGTHGGPPSLSAYSASKGAIVMFTKVLAKEVGRLNIRANAIAPGWVDTAFNDPVIEFLGGQSAVDRDVEMNVPLGRQGRPEEIAAGIAFLASDDASYMTGQALVVNGGAG
ncbi:SDR family NAD(P)-dependent oxidoreductase [Microbacterium immunditiarum]|uniref:Dihydroanticapsin dehydrogenase n=1 Tax=Microbacterium immunditiarum TaxID=337480 RepID=A0A7Y9KIE3_9MICO|nr:SDR family NAD(P)-dependent oxidoreductase [Microbacterium immunditiarum]NYE18516.1 dihydroanticapsin dehydrogenase [Microbacterium immunditiarum]